MSISSDYFISEYTKTKQEYLILQSALYKISSTGIAIGSYILPSKLAWLYFDLFEKFGYNDETTYTVLKTDGTTETSYMNINQLTDDEYSTCFAFLSKIVGSMTNLKF